MPSREVEELSRRLVRERLADQAPVDAALAELGAHATTDSLLQRLENRGVLTSYQVGRIQKGEWDELVLGHYKLMYRNAAGSFARVFRAVDLRTGKMIGLKVLRQRWTKDPSALKDFVREAEMCRPLVHPNIVPIYEIGKDSGCHFFTMEFVEGGNLRDIVKIRGKLSPKDATKCVLDITEGLNYAFQKGVTHRDLKLTNVLMSTSGQAKLVDFGLGGGPTEDSSDAESLQRAVEYATLEKNTGAPRNDPRSDMYFLGVIYYELVTGIPPYERTKDRNERSQFSRYQNVRPVRQVDPSLPGPICRIIDRMMSLNPNVRYQSPGEALPDLQAALRDLDGISAAAAPAKAEAPEPPRPAGPALPAVLFVESRTRHQDLFREYFTKHKYRVLVLQDIQRGVNRVKTMPPEAVVVMAEGIGEDALDGFRDIQQGGGSLVAVLVLSEKQSAWATRVRETPQSRVLQQPITLRDLRKTIEKLSKTKAVDENDDD